MKARIKVPSAMLATIRADLARPHQFAHERVGFLTAGAALFDGNGLLLLVRDYRPVDEEDYVPDRSVGVKIGADAMRKALQAAYRPASTVLHIHTHGGLGRPHFSGVDRRSAGEFIPSFFNPVPRMPHGIVVLSDDGANGLLWIDPHQAPVPIADIISVGGSYRKYGAMV